MHAKIVMTEKEREDAFSVRRQVFVEEQGVPLHLELDDYDDYAVHFVAYDGDNPIAAGRVREMDDHVGKVERVCVLPQYRGKHLGFLMMEKMEEFAVGAGLEKIKLSAQSYAIPFYEKQSYIVTSPEFMDAGIPHRAMEKIISPNPHTQKHI